MLDGHVNSLKSRLGKYTPATVYNELKTILRKYWDWKKSYTLNIKDKHPDITNF